MGTHQGSFYFTIGQRRGLDVGGTIDPLFVIATDIDTNIIYTGEGKNHPGLFRKALFISNEELHWIRTDLALKVGELLKVKCLIRYRQPLQEAILYQFDEGLYVEFIQPQSAITEGQFAAWYLEKELVGSGVIS